jgi:hypothetical protein
VPAATRVGRGMGRPRGAAFAGGGGGALGATASIAITASAALAVGGAPTLLFDADWGTATGNSSTACTDGGYFDSVTGTYVPLNVVTAASTPAAFSRTANALRITQRGSTISTTLERTAALPLNSDAYGEFFFLNGGNTSIHNHPIVHNTFGGFQAIPFGMSANATDFVPLCKMLYDGTGAASGYPIQERRPGVQGVSGEARLAHNTWYRYRWRLEIVTPGAPGALTTYRFYPYIYSYNNSTPNTLGTLLYGPSTYFRQDYGGTAGDNLQAYYDGGGLYGAPNSTLLRNIGVGQEGAAGATDTGNHWYIANMRIWDTGWVD